MSDSQSGSSAATGQGGVKRYEPGGVISGTGTVTKPDGEVVEFTMESDPLTPEQANQLNQE